ncbi:adenylate kinase 8 isoform X2 [Syngnathoides biaculeatus]|uniref:adenylate kinase 8 isoform X2 n=1 Tax=Syngnathoides biaculeatus TaxID=300417 RepID=UPI002ADD9FF5|nr:adenylate kinase 8 isoform X2 [Syngnathoides biaculeatus]
MHRGGKSDIANSKTTASVPQSRKEREEDFLFFLAKESAAFLLVPLEVPTMEDGVRPLRVPPQMSIYADQHNVIHLVQTMVSGLAVDQPEDPIAYLLLLLQESSVHVPRVVLLGPPAVGKTTLARKLCADLGAVHVTMETLLDDQSQLGERARRCALGRQVSGHACDASSSTTTSTRAPTSSGGSRRSSGGPDPRETQTGRLLQHVAVRRVVDVCVACFRAGFSTDFLKLACRLGISSRAASFPNTAAGRRRRRSFGAATWPAAGHAHRRYAAHAPVRAVTSLPVSATSSRAPEDAYRETSARPRDDAAEGRASDLQRHRCEVTGMSAAYRHVLKTVDGDQPPTDVYQQVVAFLRTRRCSRTPRVLLLGPPGSGKKHQAKMLSDKYKMVDVCCCDLLRWAEADPSWIGEEVRTYLQHNRPVPNGVTLNVLQERLNRADCSQRGWILHHLPCDLQHAKHLKRSLNAPNRVFFLELTDAVCLHRTAAKRTPTDPGVDAATVRECDDNARTVAHALGVYRTHTAGLQGVFPDGVHVDADQDPRYVFEALDRQLTVQTHTH